MGSQLAVDLLSQGRRLVSGGRQLREVRTVSLPECMVCARHREAERGRCLHRGVGVTLPFPSSTRALIFILPRRQLHQEVSLPGLSLCGQPGMEPLLLLLGI